MNIKYHLDHSEIQFVCLTRDTLGERKDDSTKPDEDNFLDLIGISLFPKVCITPFHFYEKAEIVSVSLTKRNPARVFTFMKKSGYSTDVDLS